MKTTTDSIKELRELTGVSVMQCKNALEEAGGDTQKALAILKKSSGASALKKVDRELKASVIGSYTHDGNIGAMALLSCETDFVAKNPEFAAFARDLAMQVAAMDPENIESLMEQQYIKDGSKNIRNLLDEATQKFGERVEVTKFMRLSAR